MKINIRNWKYTDTNDLVYLCNHVDRSYLTDSIPFPYTKEEALHFIHFVKKDEGITGIFRAIEVDKKVVGEISIVLLDDIHRCVGTLGYYLLDEYKGKGVMSQAIQDICKVAFQKFYMTRISAMTFEENYASRKVLEKNGFHLEATLKNNIIKDSIVHNECIYALFVEDVCQD